MQFAFGESAFTIDTNAEPLVHRGAAAIADEHGAVLAALRNPIGTAPLCELVKPGERVAILVNDITRLTRTDLFLPLLIAELNAAGVPDRDLFIVFATGIHRRQTPEEHRRILGDEIARRIRHDAPLVRR